MVGDRASTTMTQPEEDGIFWRSNLLTRLDLALHNSGVEYEGPRRDPANLRAAARYCREVASSSAAVAENLRAVADELEAEALRNELYLERKVSRRITASVE
jgi:hypothetical protein